MSRIPSLAAALVALSLPTHARAEAAWSQDFDAARKQAAAEHHDLLLDFTGSDWCGPCIALHKTVFSTEVFEAGVKDKFVLAQFDYPRATDKLTPAILEQNQKLKDIYGISGFPTVMLCDAEGMPYAAMIGFGKTEPDAYVAHLDELRVKREARDKGFAEARAASGPEKAKLLADALVGMGLDDGILYSRYTAVLDEMKEADPADGSGLVGKAASKSALAHFHSGLGQFLEAPGIHSSRQIGDLPGALEFTNGIIASGKLMPADLTQVVCFRASSLLAKTDLDAALKSLDEAKEETLDETSKRMMQQTRGMLEKRKQAAAAAAAKEDATAKPEAEGK